VLGAVGRLCAVHLVRSICLRMPCPTDGAMMEGRMPGQARCTVLYRAMLYCNVPYRAAPCCLPHCSML
jgi:hypothetical protein